MTSSTSQSWRKSGDPAATIRAALEAGVAQERIVSHLSDKELDHLPKSRIKAIVETTPQPQSGDEFDLPLSQPPSTDSDPRTETVRTVAVHDLELLSPREAARIIGLTLEQFDGNTIRPGQNTDTEVDLYWHRQRMSVGIRVAPVIDGPVSSEEIDTLVDGPVVTEQIKRPSELAIVTNGKYTDEAIEKAAEHDIHVFDEGHIRAWFQRARLPFSAVGTVLEDGENHDGPLSDLVGTESASPQLAIDPLKASRIPDITIQSSTGPRPDEESIEGSTERSEDEPSGGPVKEGGASIDPPAPGQTETLYADPSEDEDEDASDEFLEGL